MIWEDPPANRPREVTDTAWVRRLEPLMAQPGRWARVLTCHCRRAWEAVNHVRKAKTRKPPGRWEFCSGWLDGVPRTTTDRKAITTASGPSTWAPRRATPQKAPRRARRPGPARATAGTRRRGQAERAAPAAPAPPAAPAHDRDPPGPSNLLQQTPAGRQAALRGRPARVPGHLLLPGLAGRPRPVEFVEVAATGRESLVQLAGTTIHVTAHVLAGRGTGHGVD
jgi:hypothetical protein